ncbi:MAG TPA: PLP-dependent aminotransferase family protein [Blastocatellia bacterium]|nr:PLP-dependent aminotransferase family protein [Blastocatellia bacterium]
MAASIQTEETGTVSGRFARRMSRIKASAIREILKVTERPDIISFAGGLPAPELFPVEQTARAFADIFAREGAAAMQYSTTEGWLPLRRWIADRLSSRGMDARSENLLITSGSQQGIDLVGKIFLDGGDKVIVENPCYLAALQSFSGYEASFIPVDSDEDGMVVEQVEQALSTQTAKLIYVVPDFHNPKGTTLSLERRQRLIELSRLHRVPILEDDPYGELRYRGERVPLLAALDRDGLVINLGTFSKTLSPGMRIGWVSASSEVIQALVTAKQAADLHTATIQQRAIARLLEDFDYEAHITKLCEVYGARCMTMLDALKAHFPAEARWTSPEGGLFLWVELPGTISGEELLQDALAGKVAFVPGTSFFANEPRRNFIRLNFSNRPPADIEEGIQRISAVLKRRIS